MKKRMKKMLSVILAVSFVFGSCPQMALAEEMPIVETGEEATTTEEELSTAEEAVTSEATSTASKEDESETLSSSEEETESATETETEAETETETASLSDSDRRAEIEAEELRLEEIREAGELEVAEFKAANNSGKAGVDYVEDEVVLLCSTFEEAKQVADKYSERTGFRVVVDSFEDEVAVLRIDTRFYQASAELGEIELLGVDPEEPVYTLLNLAENYDMPKVYRNGIVKIDSVGDTVKVNTVDENNGGVLDFTDPNLGGDPNRVDDEGNPAPTGIGSVDDGYAENEEDINHYQWFHELINDKYVWYEMNKLKEEGDSYDGALTKQFNENLANTTVAVIDTGINSHHPEWEGTDKIVAGKSFIDLKYLIVPDERPADEDFPADPEEKPVYYFAPDWDDVAPVEVVYPVQRPIWKEGKTPEVAAAFIADYEADHAGSTEEEINAAWKELLKSEGEDENKNWKKAWEYMWHDDIMGEVSGDESEAEVEVYGYVNAYKALYNDCEKGAGEGGDPDSGLPAWKLAWYLLKEIDWKTAYIIVSDYQVIEDQNGYECEPNNFGTDHGANVSGIVAEPADNIEGRGVAAGVKVMPLKVFSFEQVEYGSEEYGKPTTDGYYYQLLKAKEKGEITQDVIDKYLDGELLYDTNSGNNADICRAINHAIYHSSAYVREHEADGVDDNGDPLDDQNVRVINMSLGGTSYDEIFEGLCDKASRYGITVVAAAGNENSSHKSYPGDSNHVINVTSLDANYELSNFSNYGSGVDIAAPGGAFYGKERNYYYTNVMWSIGGSVITSAEGEVVDINYDNYSPMHGTSQATPVVAGVAALLWAQYPESTPEEIEELLISSAKAIKTRKANVNKCVDAAAALGISTDNNSEFAVNTYSSYTDEKVTEVASTKMGRDSKLVMYHPNEHAVFYYTVDGSEPVISDEAGSEDSRTFVSNDGIIDIEDLLDATGNKSSFTVKAKMLLYGVQSKTKTIKIGIANETDILGVRCKDTARMQYVKTLDLAKMKYDKTLVPANFVDIYPGGSLQLEAYTGLNNKTYANVYWKSDDTSALTVSATGLVKAKLGTADASVLHVITAIDKDDPNNTAVFGVVIRPKTKDIFFTAIGSRAKLTAITLPSDCTDASLLNMADYVNTTPADASRKFIYESLNSNVVSIDADGIMKVNSDGLAKLVVKATDGSNVKKEISVLVGEGSGYSITAPELITPGKKATLKASPVADFGLKDVNLEWYVCPDELGKNIYLTGENAYDSSKPETVNLHADYEDYFTLDAKKGTISVKKEAQNLEAASFTIGIRIKDNNVCLGSTDIAIYPITTKLATKDDSKVKNLNLIYTYGWVKLINSIDVEPANTYGKYEITSSNTKVAVIPKMDDAARQVQYENELWVKLIGVGSSTITIKALDGSNKKTTVKINVLDSDRIGSAGLTEKNDLQVIYPGATLKYALYTENNSKEYSKDVFFLQKNKNAQTDPYEYLKVFSDGRIKANDSLKDATFSSKEDRLYWATNQITLHNGEVLNAGAPIYLYQSAVKKVIPTVSDTYIGDIDGRISNYAEIEKSGVTFTKVGDTKYIFANVEPDGECYGESFTYKSSNEKVCKVYSSGMLKATGSGKATITVTAKDGSKKSASFNVSVTSPVVFINVIQASGLTDVAIGKSLKFGAEVNASATNKKVNWQLYKCKEEDGYWVPDYDNEVTDKKEATVANGTLSVKATATLTEIAVVATAADGSVGEPVRGYQVVSIHPVITSITPSMKQVTLATKDVTIYDETGNPIYGPEYATQTEIPITFEPASGVYIENCAVTTSNAKVATAKYIYDKESGDASVLISAVEAGKAKITIKALDGSNKSTVIDVTVVTPVEYLFVRGDKNIDYVQAGKSLQMKAYTNKTASNKKIEWMITGAEIVSGDNQGALSAEEYDDYVSISKTGKLSVNKNIKGTTTPIKDEIEVTVAAISTDRYSAGNNISGECTITVNKRLKSGDLSLYVPDDKTVLNEGESIKLDVKAKEDVCNGKVVWGIFEGKEEGGVSVIDWTKPLDKKIATITQTGLVKVGKSNSKTGLDLRDERFYVGVWAADNVDEVYDYASFTIAGDVTEINCYDYISGAIVNGSYTMGLTENMVGEDEGGQFNLTQALKFAACNSAGEQVSFKDEYSISITRDSDSDEPEYEAEYVEEDDVLEIKFTDIGENVSDEFTLTVAKNDKDGHAGGVTNSVNIHVDKNWKATPQIDEKGKMQKILSVGSISDDYTNVGSEVARFCVYVHTDYDTDKDGQLDLVKVYLKVPVTALMGAYKVPIIYDPTPYAAGTASAKLNKNSQYTYGDYDDPVEVGPRLGEGYVDTYQHAMNSKISDWAMQPETGNIIYPNSIHYDTAEDRADGVTTSNLDYFLERGYAVAYSTGIGTYGSEGIEMCGTKWEKECHKAVVEWLGGNPNRGAWTDIDTTEGHSIFAEDWSNGNVAMVGTSYGGTLAYEVATTGVEELKTIISFGGIADWYSYTNSQGIALDEKASYSDYLSLINGGRLFDRFGGNANTEKVYTDYLGKTSLQQLKANGDYGYMDGEEYVDVWGNMNYSVSSNGDPLNIRCSAMIVSGINDYNVTTKQADYMYRAFNNAGQKTTMILHQGGHTDLFGRSFAGFDGDTSFNEFADRWLSAYLFDNVTNLDNFATIYAQSSENESEWYFPNAWEGYDSNTKSFVDAPGNVKRNSYTVNDLTRTTEDSVVTASIPEKTGNNAMEIYAKAMDDETTTVTYALDVASETIVCGSPVVNIKAAVDWGKLSDAIEVPDAPEPGENLTLESMIDNGDNIDGMELTGYLLDIATDEDGNVNYSDSAVVSYGWLDLNNPGGGYYSNDKAYKKPTKIVKGETNSYTLYMKATYHTVKAGHKLVLVLCENDIVRYEPNNSLYSFGKINGIDTLLGTNGVKGYSFEIKNEASDTLLQIPVALHK